MKKAYPLILFGILFLYSASTCRTGSTGGSGTFTVAGGGSVEIPDPLTAVGLPQQRICRELFEGLVCCDPGTSDAVPGIAESWSVSPDGRTFTFALRESTWSDGVPVTARTFAGSWLRVLNPENSSPNARVLSALIKGAAAYASGTGFPDDVAVRTDGDYVLRFESTVDPGETVQALLQTAFLPVPLHIIENAGPEWRDEGYFTGNGPFLPEQVISGDRIVLVPNPRYWDADSVKVPRVVFLSDDDSDQDLYDSGTADWIPSGPAQILTEGLDDLVSAASAGVFYIAFNTKMPPFDDVLVRKAFSSAVDRSELAELLTGSWEVPAFGVIPVNGNSSGNPAFDSGKAGEIFNRAKDRAETSECSLAYSVSPRNDTIAGFLRDSWNELPGIICVTEALGWQQYLRASENGSYHMIQSMQASGYWEPSLFLKSFVTSASGNYGRYSNVRFDALVGKAALLEHGKKRTNILKEAERILIGEDQAVIPLFFYASVNRIDLDAWDGWYPNVADIHPLKYIKRSRSH